MNDKKIKKQCQKCTDTPLHPLTIRKSGKGKASTIALKSYICPICKTIYKVERVNKYDYKELGCLKIEDININ